MQETSLKGRKFTGATRAPKTYSNDRTCADASCETRLSQYNRREWCYAHAPTKYPRLGGRIVKTDALRPPDNEPTGGADEVGAPSRVHTHLLGHEDALTCRR